MNGTADFPVDNPNEVCVLVDVVRRGGVGADLI